LWLPFAGLFLRYGIAMTPPRSGFLGILAWARAEIGILAAILIAALALLGFGTLAATVMEGETSAFDRAILLALRSADNPSDPIGPRWFELAVSDVTSLGSFAVLGLITLGAVGYLVADNKRHAALLVLIAVGGGTALSSGMKVLFERPRPDIVAHLAHVQTQSFPSGHAMLSAVTFLTLGAILMRVQPRRRMKAYIIAVAIVLTLLVGLSRIYLGVHWPTDVLGGWCLGAAWALMCWLVAAWLQARRQVEEDSC
jgi:undecaprenyl-diphosphatase